MALGVSFGTLISLLVVFLVNVLSTDAATLGQDCNNTNTCTGDHVVCSNTRNICDCETGYQNNSAADACVVEKGLGSNCSLSLTVAQCAVTNAECAGSSSSATCQCKYGFYDTNGIDMGGTCEAKKGLGYTCSLSLTVAQCTDISAECAGSGSSGTCQCKSDFYDTNGNNIGGTCEAKRDLGNTCSLSLTEAQCTDTNAECAESNSSVTCQCKSDFYDTNGNDMGGTCEAKKDLGYTCSLPLTVAECADTNAECAGSSSQGTCQCKSGFFDNNGNNLGGTCEAKKDLGNTCSLSLTEAQCADTNAECAGSSPSATCQCKSDFYDNNGIDMGGTCEAKKGLGNTCSLSLTEAQCAVTNSECAGSGSSVTCQCKSDFYDTNGNNIGGTCEAKVGLGSACPQPNACSTTNSVCSNSTGGGTCVCGNDYYDNNGNTTMDGTCSTKVVLGLLCAMPDACITTNAVCSNPNGGGTCICGNGYYDSNGNTTSDGTCLKKVVLGLMCPQPDACSTTNAVCSNPTGGGTCICGNSYYDSNGDATSDGTCLKKVGLGYNCSQPDACSESNTNCNQDICVCNTGFYDSNGPGANNGTCVLKVPLGSQCTMSTACATTNSVCLSSTCQCSSNFYDDNGANPEGNCQNRIILNNLCNNNAITSYQQRAQCQDGNAECSYTNAYICTCKQGYHSQGYTCVADKPLGGSCDYKEECSDRNAQCSQKKCTCDIGFYVSSSLDSGEKCLPVSNLAVTDITFSDITNTSITVSWRLPEAASYINVLIVSWRPSTGTGQTVTLSSPAQTSYTISSHIEPGRAYNISITSRNTMTEIGSNRETVSTGYQAAKPNVPTGPLQLIDFDASDRQITIGWPNVPYASGFDVSLMDGSLLVNESTQTANTWQIYDINILNGYRYNVTLRTRSEVHISGTNPVVFSGTYREQIKTKVQAPDPPMSPQCTTGESYSIPLTWLPPSYPNGDLVQYHIEVYAQANPNNALAYHSTGNISTRFTVTRLSPGFTYLFKISTENEMFNSTRSLNFTCKTTARKSGEPTNLTVTGVTSRSMHVWWDYPERTNSEEISGYILQIKDNSGSCVHEQLFKCQDCKDTFQNPAGVLCADNVRQSDKWLTIQQLSKRVTYNVTGLLPDIEYSASVSAVNLFGQGNTSVFVQKSDEEEPQLPTNISATDIRQTTMIVTWKLPDPRPGSTTFTITLTADFPAEPSITTAEGFEKTNVLVHNLEEFWTYSVSVTATTSKGSKTANSTAKYTTKPDAPGPVGNFTVVTPGKDVHKLKASWMIPTILQRNSNITGYVFVQNVSGTEIYIDVPFVSESHMYEETLSVIPENFYIFEVYAKNQEGKNGTETRINMEAPAGVPNNEFEMGSVKVIPSAPAVSQTTVTIVVKQDFLRQSKNGQIRLNGLIGCEHSKCNILGSSMNKAEFEKMRTYNEASKKGFIPYRITKDDWGKSGSRKRRALEDEITYTVGTERCDSNVTTYCNGPLPPDTSFSFIVVTCTNGGCLLSSKYGPYRTEKEPDELPVGAIIGGVVGGVAALVIIVIIIGVLMYRRRNQGPGKMTKIVEDAAPNLGKIEDLNISRKRPVKLSEFEAHLKEMHKDTNLQFSAAYEDLKAISPRHSQNAANEEDNKMKNRYINILPFDHSRVKLSASGEDTKEDYINANYLPGYRSPREYIGCQGPLPGTIDDFWRMVWEQNVSVVVMLTLCKEQQKVKCEQYWPNEVNDPKQFGDVVVEVTSYSSIKTYDFRVFKLVCNGRTRILKHFHFLTWLDFQANVQHEIIIDFITQVRSHVQPPDTAGPMIIHCSAGVGRTGTYIVLDHLMQYIDEHDFEVNIDIFDMVLKLRENRPHMVQTEQQFVFIHDCVKVLLDKKRIAMAEQNNIYENRAFDTKEDNIYQNQQELTYENVQMKTEL